MPHSFPATLPVCACGHRAYFSCKECHVPLCVQHVCDWMVQSADRPHQEALYGSDFPTLYTVCKPCKDRLKAEST